VLTAALVAASLACEDDGPTGPGGSLPFADVLMTDFSGIVSPRTEVIRDESRWAAVWSEIHALQSDPPARPVIDFSQEMLVLVAIGQRSDSCWGVTILSLDFSGGRINLRAEERHVIDCVCLTVITHPIHVVRTPRTDGALSSEVVLRNTSCQ
jgi:hypothetical protein